MIDLKWLYLTDETGEKNSDYYKKVLINRGGTGEEVETLLNLDKKRKDAVVNFDERKAQQNQASKDFAKLKKNGEDTSEQLKKMQELSLEVKELEKQAQQAQEEIKGLLEVLPNILFKDVPVGKCEGDNPVKYERGAKPQFEFTPREHWEIGELTQTIDFDRAAKISGARFAFLRDGAARLERALIQFMLDKQTLEHGYEEIFPPLIVEGSALYGTGTFPKFKEDVFKIEGRDGYLIPTSEVPLTNFYANEILNEAGLPKNLSAYTPCFRSEAGSYGRDTKGLIRQHQFNKVEIVKVTHPDRSEEEHLKLLADAEAVLKDLELHYQVVELCSGDISFGAARCFDINVWLPGQQAYREISSCSNLRDFQARRANIRFKPSQGGKPQFVHTLNGSGLAVGRTLVAIYENYQQKDGSVIVPKVLRKYINNLEKIEVKK